LQEAREREKQNVELTIEEVEEIKALRTRVTELEALNATLASRSQNLQERYEEGDLVSHRSQIDMQYLWLISHVVG